MMLEESPSRRSAAGAPWRNFNVPPDVRGARTKAVTSRHVSFDDMILGGTATAKQSIARRKVANASFQTAPNAP
jgi:hypothetical protein